MQLGLRRIELVVDNLLCHGVKLLDVVKRLKVTLAVMSLNGYHAIRMHII